MQDEVIVPRTALICAAVFGWAGDDWCSWPSPAEKQTILAWAQFYGSFPEAELQTEFDRLVDEGLFFRVHADAFEQPCYYCSYDSRFIMELLRFDIGCADPAKGETALEFWMRFPKELDAEFGAEWRNQGMCKGQGSQGSWPWGPCLGRECCCLSEDKEARCTWDLKFLR